MNAMLDPNVGEVVTNLITRSPFATHLGVEFGSLGRDEALVALGFRPELVTISDVVHGGAIASLIDIAATAAVWSGATPEPNRRGATVGFTVNFLRAARGCGLRARARVIQRGKTLSVAEVAVEDDEGAAVARALVTYKIG
jgi:uncharacterized protein (TIGR00369 family)